LVCFSVSINASVNLGDDWDSAFVSNKYYSNRTDTSLKGASIIFNALDALINKQLEENGTEYFKYTVFGVIAIRLYDGVSYINISNPFILAPETTFNKFIWYQEKKAVGTSTSLHTHSIVINMDIPEGSDRFWALAEEKKEKIKNASNRSAVRARIRLHPF
jgi:hypothetical protein